MNKIISFIFLSLTLQSCFLLDQEKIDEEIKKRSKNTLVSTGEKPLFENNKAVKLFNEGLAALRQKKYELAIDKFTQAEQIEPMNPSIYMNRGSAYDALNEFVKAIEDFSSAIKLDPTMVAAYSNRGLAYYRMSENEYALIDFDFAIELDPTESVIYLNRGLVYLDMKLTKKACEDWHNAISLGAKSKYGNRVDDLIRENCRH